MTPVGRLWRTLNQRVGKVQQAVVLGVLAAAITVPIAVAGPQGSANLQTTPTATAASSTATSSATASSTATSSAAASSTATSSAVLMTATSTAPGGAATVAVTAPAGTTFTLGATNNPSLTRLGLTPGTHTVTAVTANGQTITGTITVSANGTITVSPNLQGVPLRDLSIVLGAVATAPSQAPAQTPRGAPGQVPAQLPHTGAGGGAL